MTQTRRSGDLDGDGQVNQSDLALLRQVLKESGHGEGLLEKLPAADRARLDVNGDGFVDQADVARLCQVMMDQDAAQAQTLAQKFSALRAKYKA